MQIQNNFRVNKIEEIIKKNSNEKDLISIVYSLGRDCQNQIEFEYARNHLKNLANNKSSAVRACVALSFSMLIQNGYKIDKQFLEPILLEIYNNTEEKDIANIIDAIEDINLVTKWNLKL